MIGPGRDGFTLNGGVVRESRRIKGETRMSDWEEMTSCPKSVGVIQLCGEKTQTLLNRTTSRNDPVDVITIT